ncbi:MAG TPA: hypothetical protein VF884_10885 [Nitrososphaeraceae archaeon]
MVEKILCLDESILSASIINMQGHIVRYKSKYHIRNGVTSHKSDYDKGTECGIWVRATYAMIEQLAKSFGKVQTFVSHHETAKLIFLPMIEINCILVLMVLPSANTEYVASKINMIIGRYVQDKDFINGYIKKIK